MPRTLRNMSCRHRAKGRGISPLILNLCDRWGGWSTPRPGYFSPRKSPGTHSTGSWVGPPGRSEGKKKKKRICSLTQFKTPNRSGRSESLNRLRYPKPSKCKPTVSLRVINGSTTHSHKLQFGVHTMLHYMD